jgi:hypothetical protein
LGGRINSAFGGGFGFDLPCHLRFELTSLVGSSNSCGCSSGNGSASGGEPWKLDSDLAFWTESTVVISALDKGCAAPESGSVLCWKLASTLALWLGKMVLVPELALSGTLDI